MEPQPVLGVIGGSGLYQMDSLTDVETRVLETPFGKPSSPITIGTLQNKRVAFIARHGIGHALSPSEINYRANIYALKSLGIQHVISVSACGSLREDYQPGEMVIPDQLVDFTKGRIRSFFGEGLVAHVSTANPFCQDLSARLLSSVNSAATPVHEVGTLITIDGPRFSTRAESNLFRLWGMSIIGMTASPEAFLAREAQLCYAVLAHITDYDVWHVTEEPVSVDMVMSTLNRNTHKVHEVLEDLVTKIDPSSDCDCRHALKNAIITDMRGCPEQTLTKLALFLRS